MSTFDDGRERQPEFQMDIPERAIFTGTIAGYEMTLDNQTYRFVHTSGGESRFRVGVKTLLEILSRGCLMCKEPLARKSEIDLYYEVSDLYCVGQSQIEAAECQLTCIGRQVSNAEQIFILDRKAAVCLKCWVNYLSEVLNLKESTNETS